jgi:hypothetical protein
MKGGIVDTFSELLAGEIAAAGVKHGSEKYVSTPLFKASLLILLPETYNEEKKEAFYNDLIKKQLHHSNRQNYVTFRYK